MRRLVTTIALVSATSIHSIALGQTTPPAGYELTETIVLPTLGQTVPSHTLLKAGIVYKIRASGTFFIGGPGDRLADADYADFSSPPASVLDHCTGSPLGVDIGIGIDDPVIDNMRSPDWGPFNANHEYTVEFVGSGATIALNYHDCAYGDNRGSLTVEIFAPNADSDGDGLTDDEEIRIYHTDPGNPDTDGDGLLDGTEVGMQPMSGVPGCPSPLDADSDDDLVGDGDEVANDTNPCDPDTDGDGICDLLDNAPRDPAGQNPASLSAAVRALCDFVNSIPLSEFDAPNGNAASGRRSSLATRICNAANSIDRGNGSSALSLLKSVLAKIDGTGEDWMLPSALRTALADCILNLCLLL